MIGPTSDRTPMMKKTLLKRILFELVEDMLRIENRISRLEQTESANMTAYLKVLSSAAADAKAQLLQDKVGLATLFDEQSQSDGYFQTFFSKTFPQVRDRMDQLALGLSQVQQATIQPETELYLNSLNLNRLLPGAPTLTVLPIANEQSVSPSLVNLLQTETHLMTHLPTLSIGSPLRWTRLTDGFIRHFIRKTVQLNNSLDKLPLPEPRIEAIAPLISLRLLGPAYYPAYVLQAIQSRDAMAIGLVEPMLFQALNRFGLIDKDWVILHQSIEKTKSLAALGLNQDLPRPMVDDQCEDLLQVVEKVIPERLAFTEKHFGRAQLLAERLENGMMISAVPMIGSPVQIRNEIDNLTEEQSIYPLLAQIREYPALPREIVTAGWMVKLDASSGWLESLMQDDSADGWEELRQTVDALDVQLLKSIEIAEVHRVLSHEDAELALSLA